MSLNKFLADENVDFRIVKALREDKYEIEAIIEINPGISDHEVLSIANILKAIILTEDKDFGELTFRLKKPNKGIILIRMNGSKVEEKIRKLKEVLENHADELSEHFTVIASDKVRIRKMY